MPNPVLNKFNEPAPPAAPPGATPEELERMYRQPSYGGPTLPPTTNLPGYGGGSGGFGGPTAPSRYMTLDDVVVRTSLMLGVILAVGAASWVLVPDNASAAVITIGALGGLGIGLYMAFTTKATAPLAMLYSAFEGAFLGGVSKAFENWKSGIVVQALLGTVMVAAGMLIVYRVGAIRVTPRLTRIVVGATIGVVGLMLVNILASLFHSGGLGLRDGGAIAIIFSLLCIAIAAFNLVLDFDMIEQGIRRGVDEKFAWYAAFGITVTLIWLYLEILRLLGYLRD